MEQFNKRVMVVGSDALLLRMYAAGVLERGYVVMSAANEKQAVKALQFSPLDTIVLDVLLPTRNGVPFLRALCDQARSRRIKTVILSASSSDQEILQALVSTEGCGAEPLPAPAPEPCVALSEGRR
jgi:DNA-binding response OmpR family regulator